MKNRYYTLAEEASHYLEKGGYGLPRWRHMDPERMLQIFRRILKGEHLLKEKKLQKIHEACTILESELAGV